uniref:T-box domain-containing protein n=1 Tax=Syphacia muris TaxID=451379 RepID=A0A0N5AMV4_9BILA
MATSSKVSIRLTNENLWKEFNSFTTEMIVTKNGRRTINTLFCCKLNLNCRFRFANGEWLPSGCADPRDPPKALSHHDGAQLGKTWMRSPICFDRVKLTNCQTDASQKLHSMHKYRPRLLVYRLQHPSPFAVFSLLNSDMTLVASYSNPITDFVAVTAYQNQKTIKLKIKYNPFAKGFREGNERKRHSGTRGTILKDSETATSNVYFE